MDSFLSMGSGILGTVLDFVLSGLVVVNTLLGQLFSASGDALKMILGFKITELTVIAIAWTNLRDLCNLAYIVVFIGIAFGTIFNATGLFKGWHFRTALMPLIVSALLINFSLAIGRTVVLVSNEAATIVIGVLKDPGAALVQATKPNSLTLGANLNAKAALGSAIVDTTKARTDAEKTRYERCLNEEKTVVDTNVSLWRYAIKYIKDLPSTKVRKTIADCNLEINDARYGTTPEQVAATGQKLAAAASGEVSGGTTNEKLMLIVNEIFKAVMIIMLISCLLSAFIFLALRIIVVWLLLALSPIAFVSYGIPGNHEGWTKWWHHITAWNVFGPLYLFSLIPGLVMLGGSGEMMLRLQAAGGDIGPAWMLVQQFFLYAFAMIIFIGGLTLSLKSSYAGVVKGTEVVGGWANKLGIFDDKGFAPARYISEKTGATAAWKGASGAYWEKYSKPFRGGGINQAEVEARFRQITTGDKGAAEKLQRARIDEQSKKIKEEGTTTGDLRKAFSAGPASGPRYFAAARSLLDDGQLDAEQMRQFATAAAGVSPQYGQVVREAIQRKMREKNKDRKYGSADEVAAAMEDLDLNRPGNERERERFLNGIRNSQPLLYAKLAGNGKIGAITGKDGKPLTTSEILEGSATKLSDEEWLEIYNEGIPLGDKAQYNFNTKLTGKDAVKILGSADKVTRAKLEAEILKRSGERQQAKPTSSQQSQQAEPRYDEESREQAAQSAAQMAGGVSDERREEIRKDMEDLKRGNSSPTT